MKIKYGSIIIALLIGIAVSGCAHVPPCDNPRFQELRQKPVEDMAMSEYAFFLRKLHQCEESQANAIGNSSSSSSTIGIVVLLGVVLALVFLYHPKQ